MRSMRPVYLFSCVLPLLWLGAIAQDRPAEGRERGGDVMPFSIGATQHVFEKSAFGGVQRVVARDGHSDQIAQIRHHLKSLAESFEKRDFSAPAHIHGDQ